MNNGLLAVVLPQETVGEMMEQSADSSVLLTIKIDVSTLEVHVADMTLSFDMSERHQRMFLEGLDMIGASLKFEGEIAAFAQRHWAQQPWVKDVAVRTQLNLLQQAPKHLL